MVGFERRVREGERTTGEFPKLSRYPFSLIKWRRLASSSGRGRFNLCPRGVLNKYTRFYTKKSSKIVNWLLETHILRTKNRERRHLSLRGTSLGPTGYFAGTPLQRDSIQTSYKGREPRPEFVKFLIILGLTHFLLKSP